MNVNDHFKNKNRSLVIPITSVAQAVHMNSLMEFVPLPQPSDVMETVLSSHQIMDAAWMPCVLQEDVQ